MRSVLASLSTIFTLSKYTFLLFGRLSLTVFRMIITEASTYYVRYVILYLRSILLCAVQFSLVQILFELVTNEKWC